MRKVLRMASRYLEKPYLGHEGERGVRERSEREE